MCNQQETCSEWITLHRIDGEEVQLEAGAIIGLVPYTQTYAPGTTVITHGGYNVTVREHISEIKELLDFEMVNIDKEVVDDREGLIAQIDTQADTILQQSKTIEYWMKQYDEAAKQLRDEHDACERHYQHVPKLMDDNSRLTKQVEDDNARIAFLTETCANQRKKICDMADGGPDMGLSLRREIARLKNDIVGLENKIIKKDADIASLTQKLNEVTDALKKVTKERDKLADSGVISIYSNSHDPLEYKIMYHVDKPMATGLSDYAKWPGTK